MIYLCYSDWIVGDDAAYSTSSPKVGHKRTTVFHTPPMITSSAPAKLDTSFHTPPSSYKTKRSKHSKRHKGTRDARQSNLCDCLRNNYYVAELIMVIFV